MTYGIFFSMLTGLTWTAIGIVLSRCARNRFDLIAYSLLQTALAGIIALVLYASPGSFRFDGHAQALSALILTAGILNALAQHGVRLAMSAGGHHAPVWAMMQAAMLVPFTVGTLVFEEPCTTLRWTAMGLLLLGVFLPCFTGKDVSFRRIPASAWGAFLLYGLLQTLYLLPSHVPLFTDSGGIRPALVCFGNGAGWVLIAAGSHHRPIWTRPCVRTACLMALIHVIGAGLFFCSLDYLALRNASSIGIPLMQSANLVAFALYAHLVLKEKNTAADWTATTVIFAGFVLLAMG